MELARNFGFRAASGTDIDIVFCVDGTGSLGDASQDIRLFLDDWKQGVRNIHSDFIEAMNARCRHIGQLRIRVILFRDYMADGEHAMMVTDFFQLPQQAAEFEACINSIHADGGGDIPEDGLEALTYAIKSQWANAGGTFKRQIIVVLTDADTHALGFGSRSEFYPKGMPKDMDELTDWWEDPAIINQRGKRLILVAPNEGNWQYISDNWELTWHIPSASGTGLAELNYSEILNLIAQAV